MKTFEDKCIAGNMLWQILNIYDTPISASFQPTKLETFL